LRESFGNIVMALMALPRYRDQTLDCNQTLGDLRHFVLDAPARPSRHGLCGRERAAGGEVAGIALWARVSEEVDLVIRRQIREGVFPIRLEAVDRL
jgi:cytolysin-activating lysine-acyltransferase